MGFARHVADQVACMDRGVVVEAGARLRQFLSQVP